MSSDQSEKDEDLVTKVIGPIGPYQWYLYCILMLTRIPYNHSLLSIQFIAPKMHYICPDTGRQTCPCHNPIFNHTTFPNNAVKRWNLICENSYKKMLMQFVLVFAILLGSLLFEMISTRIGPKRTIIMVMLAEATAYALAPFVKNYWWIIFVRLVQGMTLGGSMVVTFPLMMEFIGKEYKNLMLALNILPMNAANMILPVIAWSTGDYQAFTIVMSVIPILMLGYVCLVPESPKYLLKKNKRNALVRILKRGAKMNKMPTDSIVDEVNAYANSQDQNPVIKSATVCEVFRTKELRCPAIALAGNWGVFGFCVMSCMQYIGHLPGNLHVNVFICASMGTLGTLTSIILMYNFKRNGKIVIILCNAVICIAIFCAGFRVLESEIAVSNMAGVGLAFTFVGNIECIFYCTDIFPDFAKQTTLWFSSVIARLGGCFAPLIIGISVRETWVVPSCIALAPLIGGFLGIFLPGKKIVIQTRSDPSIGIKTRSNPSIGIKTRSNPTVDSENNQTLQITK